MWARSGKGTDVNTSSTSFVKKAISALSAFALVATMTPAAAFATEGSSSTSDAAAPTSEIINEAHPVENNSASDASSDAQTSASEAYDANSTSSEAQTQPQGANNAKSDVERVRATVSLNSDEAQTLFSFAGLNYAANADGKTATLVGVANTSLEGDITIPSEVVSNGITYAVTNISSTLELRGGGSRLRVILMA